MIRYTIREICSIVNGRLTARGEDSPVEFLLYDSRKVQQPATSLFFALVTAHNNGHRFLADAYAKGIRNFVVSGEVEPHSLEGANVVVVEDTLAALQQLAAFHRGRFSMPVIGITGSNGKTIVKEWLYQLLQDLFTIVRSPKSFNSQVGVPLSVWQMGEQHTLALFEAGISAPGEMEKLQKVIKPTIGLFTNLGEAHSAYFSSPGQKLAEKLTLFAESEVVIGEDKYVAPFGARAFSWGRGEGATLQVSDIKRTASKTIIESVYKREPVTLSIPFTDEASVQNALNCWCVLLYLQVEATGVQPLFDRLHPVDMRLQLKHAVNGCLLINDSYSADIDSLKIALDFLEQQSSGLQKTAILSEFFESGQSGEALYTAIAGLLKAHGIKKVIAIGERMHEVFHHALDPSINYQFYFSTDDFLNTVRPSQFYREIILVKGARRFAFERIARLFEQKQHQTVLEINLNALAHNLKEYQRQVRPTTKMMAMVKAFSYGSGGAEIASMLQYHNANYLGVAYADEGVELVKSGIRLPIMVMNAEPSSFQAIVDYSLQPVIYSFEVLQRFEAYIREQGLSGYPVHIEVETGMNRLGFALHEVPEMARHIAATSLLTIQSVFSHLAASEDPRQDTFTEEQAAVFQQATDAIKHYITYPFLRHISNSAAIVRHPRLQFDMVRLGIGLYGVEIDNDNRLDLQAVATLRSTIAQLKEVKKGESVSYNRRGVVTRDSLIATVRIGYADGYSRRFGHGVGKMLVNGVLAPVIGTVCMDMTMIDVTDVQGVREGDDVVLFGPQLAVQLVAEWIGTIPYEIMTSVSQRVKRVYFHE